jgi:hypothetical protein
MKLSISVLIVASTVVALLILPCESLAQRSPNRGLNMASTRNARMICEDTLRMFQIKSGYLADIPPLYTSMPLDVLVAYIGADSIARTVFPSQLKNFVSSIGTFNDTLKQFGRLLYRVVDWNPILFRQYSRETSFRRIGISNDTLHYLDSNGTNLDTLSGAPPELYRVSLSMGLPSMVSKYLQYMPDSLDKRSIRALLHADFILRVMIDSVDSCRDYLTGDTSQLSFAIYASVLDTLKGRVFPNLCYNANQYLQPYQAELRAKLDQPQPQSSGEACNKIRFETWHGAYWTGYWAAYPNAFKRDSTFLDTEGNFVMRPGTECIVFLTLGNQLIDDDYDYYNLGLNTTLSYGVLRVADGNIIDQNHVWSPTNLSISQFKQRFDQLVNVVTQP